MTDYPEIDKAIASLERQIDQLRRQSSNMASDLSHRAGRRAADLRSSARGLSGDVYDGAASGWYDADRYARRGAHHLAEYARENPGTLSTAGVAAAGLIGLGIWWLLRPNH